VVDFSRELDALRNGPQPILAEVFGSELDATWIEHALEESTPYTLRNRKISREDVVWRVIAMAIWRDKSIGAVARFLGFATPGQGEPSKVADSSISQARRRVKPQSMHKLFIDTSRSWVDELVHQETLFHGLRVFACDGTTLSVVDTAENRSEFGGPTNQHGDSGYPQIRLMVMMATSSHVVVDAAFAGYSGKGTGEKTLVRGMALNRPDRSVVLFDAGLFDSAELWAHQSAGQKRHWLGRIKGDQSYKVIEVFGPDDELARITFTAKARRAHPGLPKTMLVRVLTGTNKDGKTIRWMTSFLDAETYTKQELLELYSERWEVELGYRESKTYMLERTKPLRSQTPDGVRQELWGIVIAYNLLRYRMARAAARVGLEGRRLKFNDALMAVMGFCMGLLWFDPPAHIDVLLENLDRSLAKMVLPPRRKRRSYPRAVKAQPKKYPTKSYKKPTVDGSASTSNGDGVA